MRAGVLGPLFIVEYDRTLVSLRPKLKQLVAFLLLNSNQLVRARDCITELWGEDVPRSGISSLQTYIVELRRAFRAVLGPRGADMLATRAGGYELVINPDCLDLPAFEGAARNGANAAAEGDDERAVALLADALDLWRGPVLADVSPGPLSTVHRVYLEETRRYVIEQRIAASLRLGRHRELLDELMVLTAANPTDEALHAQLMVALYRSGRPRAANAVFRSLHQVLGERLAIEPLPALWRLHEAIREGREPLILSADPRSARPRLTLAADETAATASAADAREQTLAGPRLRATGRANPAFPSGKAYPTLRNEEFLHEHPAIRSARRR